MKVLQGVPVEDIAVLQSIEDSRLVVEAGGRIRPQPAQPPERRPLVRRGAVERLGPVDRRGIVPGGAIHGPQIKCDRTLPRSFAGTEREIFREFPPDHGIRGGAVQRAPVPHEPDPLHASLRGVEAKIGVVVPEPDVDPGGLGMGVVVDEALASLEGNHFEIRSSAFQGIPHVAARVARDEQSLVQDDVRDDVVPALPDGQRELRDQVDPLVVRIRRDVVVLAGVVAAGPFAREARVVGSRVGIDVFVFRHIEVGFEDDPLEPGKLVVQCLEINGVVPLAHEGCHHEPRLGLDIPLRDDAETDSRSDRSVIERKRDREESFWTFQPFRLRGRLPVLRPRCPRLHERRSLPRRRDGVRRRGVLPRRPQARRREKQEDEEEMQRKPARPAGTASSAPIHHCVPPIALPGNAGRLALSPGLAMALLPLQRIKCT